MLLTELLRLPVLDATGKRIGIVADARFTLDPDTLEASLLGLLVSARTHAVFLGYERKSETAPALIARFLSWRDRGTSLALPEHIGRMWPEPIRVSRNYRRY